MNLINENTHEDFDYDNVSAMDSSEELIVGRPYAGVAIMYRKSLYDVLSHVDYKDTRLIGIALDSTSCKTLFVNVYLPYNKEDNFVKY